MTNPNDDRGNDGLPAGPADGEPRGAVADGGSAPSLAVVAKPRVWPVYLAFGLALGAILFTSLVLGIVAAVAVMSAATLRGEGLPDPEQFKHLLLGTPWFVMVLVVLSTGICLAIAAAGGFFSKEGFRARLAIRRPRPAPLWLWLLAMLGTLAVSSGWGDLIRLFHLESNSITAFNRLVTDSGPVLFAFVLLWAGLVTPMAEEMFFRGYCQTRLVSRYGVAVGAMVASAMFGVMHLDLVQGAYACCIGLYLGFLVLRFGSLWPAVAAHAVTNSVSIIGSRAFSRTELAPSGWRLCFDLAVCAATLVLATAMIRRRLPTTVAPG